MRDSWPLVGRADELSYVVRSLDERGAVLLAGAPGVGKSRLAAEALAAAEADGWATVSLTVGVESAAVPFAPFAPLLGEDAAGDGVDRFVRATKVLASRGERVVVAIDDAHLLDEVSIAFVRHLLTAQTARLVLTARSGEPTPPAVAALWQGGLVQRVELQPLSRSEVAELLEVALEGKVELATVRWMTSTSEGNPLFVRELVLDAIDRGGLALRGGRWVLTSPSTGPGPRLLEVVAARIGGLPHEEHRALELLAVGEPLGLQVFEDLVGPALVQALERRGLVVTRTERQRVHVHLTHPLHAEVLRDGLGTSTARDLRRQLIAALSGTGANRADDPLRLATWRCDVGDTADWKPLLEAAHDLATAFERPLVAMWTGDKEAIGGAHVGRSHLDVALRLATAAFDASRSIDAAVLMNSLMLRLGLVEEAEALDARLDELAATDRDRVEVARMRGDAALFFGHDAARAIEELRRVEQETDDPSCQVSARLGRALLVLFTGGSPHAVVEIASAVLSDPRAPRYETFQACGMAAMALGDIGRTREAMALLDRANGMVQGDDDSTIVGLLMACRVLVLAQAGRLVEADQVADLGVQVSDASGSDEGVGLFGAARSATALALGKAATAMHWSDVALQRLPVIDILGTRRAAIATRAHGCALLGNLEEADAAVALLDAMPRNERWNHLDELRIRSWVDVAAGRTSAALARLQAAVETAAAQGRAGRELLALHDLVRLGHAHLAAGRLEELVGQNDSELMPAVVDQARGLVDRDPGRLASAAEAFGALGLKLFEAEAWAQAAMILDADGKRTAAATATARGRAALDECEGAWTPAISVADPADQLTPREREIAGLAARGLTDRDIADQLVVSVRTVHTHLYNAYAKLGVDGRAGLRELLGT